MRNNCVIGQRILSLKLFFICDDSRMTLGLFYSGVFDGIESTLDIRVFHKKGHQNF